MPEQIQRTSSKIQRPMRQFGALPEQIQRTLRHFGALPEQFERTLRHFGALPEQLGRTSSEFARPSSEIQTIFQRGASRQQMGKSLLGGPLITLQFSSSMPPSLLSAFVSFVDP